MHRYCTGQGIPPDAETVTRIARACGASSAETYELLEIWLTIERERLRPRSGAQHWSGHGEHSDPSDLPAAEKTYGRSGFLRHSNFAMLLTAFSVAAMALVAPAPPARTDPTADEVRPRWISAPSWAMFPKPVAPSMFGVTADSDTGEMPALATGTVRFWDSGTRWANLQPRRDTFDWTTLDRLVTGARRAGVESVLTLGGPPPWAAPNAAPMPYPDGSRAAGPDSLADWDGFVRQVVQRYQGRIDAYELWAMANDSRFYTGGVPRLVELTRRASHIIKQADPHALVVCPGMGQLWKPQALRVLKQFAAYGGYSYCDVASIALHLRKASDPPEAMLRPLQTVDRVMQQTGIHPPLWNTAALDPAAQNRLTRQEAIDYAVRFYLTGLYGTTMNLQRMYLDNWGDATSPVALQVATERTAAARAVEQLQRWLAHSRISSCGQGVPVGLPSNVWQCEFTINDQRALIRWTHTGTAHTVAPPGATTVRHLDNTTTRVRPGDPVPLTEQPVLVGISRCPDSASLATHSARKDQFKQTC